MGRQGVGSFSKESCIPTLCPRRPHALACALPRTAARIFQPHGDTDSSSNTDNDEKNDATNGINEHNDDNNDDNDDNTDIK